MPLSGTPPPPLPRPHPHRSLRLAQFTASITWAVAASGLAARAARGLTVRFQLSDEYLLLNAVFLVFLLAIGFLALQGVTARNVPFRQTLGLPRRPTAGNEWAVGMALGWATVLLAVLPMTLGRALHTRIWLDGRSLWLVVLNLATVLLLALAAEMAFCGYPFQRLIDAIGRGWATVVMSLMFALFSTFNQDSSYFAMLIAFLAGLLLCAAWLRTHGIWLSWGVLFGWTASLGIVFGMPVAGISNLSSVVQIRAIGPSWLTGGDLGPQGALVMPVLLLAGMGVLVRVTRDWAWDYARKPLIPAGYAMDVAPPPEHMAMERQEPAAPSLVQILPAARPVEPDR